MTDRLHRYSVFGLELASNIPLPGLHPPTGLGRAVRLDAAKTHDIAAPEDPPHYEAGFEAHWHDDDGRWLSRYGAGSGTPLWSLETHSRGARIDVRWSDPGQLPDIPAIVQGAGLAMALHQQDAFILHASAVAVAGRAILVIGNSGAGKSSTAAALVRGGCPLISDDMAVLDVEGEGIAVRRGPLRMRIYEDFARAAGWTDPLPKLFHHPVFDDKRYIDVPDTLQSATAPVDAIFVLQPADGNADRPLIERLAPRAALGHLLQNIYRAPFLDAARARLAAGRCAWIAGRVPVVTVRRPGSLEALPGIAGAITRFAFRLV